MYFIIYYVLYQLFAVYLALQFCCLLLSFFLAVYQLSCRLSGGIFCFIFLPAYFAVACVRARMSKRAENE